MQSLTEGKVSTLLLKFSGPFMLAGAVTTVHNLLNVFLLSWLASPASVAGAFNGMLIMFTVTGGLNGLAMGGVILLGQFVGAKQDENSAKVVGNIAIVQFAIAIFCSVLFLTLGQTIIGLLNVPDYYLEDGLRASAEAWNFIRVMAFGMVFQLGFGIMNSILRSLGDSTRPMIFVAITAAINITLDLFFIGLLNMGAAGAALATVVAQATGLVIAIIYIKRKKFPFPFNKSYIRPDGAMLKSMFKIGIPLGLQMLLNNISFMVIAGIINAMGTAQSAANSLANSIFNFVVLVPGALGGALTSIAAQNFGAGKTIRALQSTKLAIMYSLMIAVPAMLIANIFPEQVFSLLSPDPDVVRVGAQFLIPFSWDFVLFVFVFCINNFYNGCGITTFVAAHELVAAFLIRIPLTWFLSTIEGATLFHVGIGTPAASLVSIVMLLIYYRVKLSGGRIENLRIKGPA